MINPSWPPMTAPPVSLVPLLVAQLLAPTVAQTPKMPLMIVGGDAQLDLHELVDADLRQRRRRGLRGLDWRREFFHLASSDVGGGVGARKDRFGDAHRSSVRQSAPLQRVVPDPLGTSTPVFVTRQVCSNWDEQPESWLIFP